MNRHQRRKAKKFENKAQHWVAKSYLRAWCDPNTPENHEPYVWIFDRDGPTSTRPGKRKAPKNIFFEPDMYTITSSSGGGDRDLSLEHLLSMIESNFCEVRREFIQPKKQLGANERAAICAFASAAQWRTPTARAHIQSQWGPILEFAQRLDARMRLMTPEERALTGAHARPPPSSKGRGMSIDEVARIVEQPLQETLPSYISALTPLLMKLEFSILCTATTPGFITSDEPAVWTDPEAHKRAPLFQSPALMYRSLEITMPISPTRMLLLSHQEMPEYVDVDRRNSNEILVGEMNRKTCRLARETIVVSRNEFRRHWALNIEPPEDECFNEHVTDEGD